MKRLIPFLALIGSPALAFENAVPVPFTADRYEKMAEKSPFALATPTAAPVVPQAGFAVSWYLTAVGRDPQGQNFVTIKSQDGSVHFSLSGNEANLETGVSLASINWSDTWRESKAIIKKGTETAEISFSKEEAPVIAAQPNGQPRPGLPGQPPMPVTTVRAGTPGAPQQPGVQPRIALPRPSTAPVVSPPPVNNTQPGGVQPAGQDRRRIRNIAAPQ